MMARRLGCVFLMSLAAATSSFAQGSPTGTISGRVTSETGALPGVTVTTTSPALQGSRVAVSSDNGDFILPLLPPGTYKVTFELQGFRTAEHSANVGAGQTVPLDVALTVAGTRRDGDGHRHARELRAAGDGLDELQGGGHRRAAVGPHAQRDGSARAGRLEHRPEHQQPGLVDPGDHHRRGHVVREPVHGQRRGPEREPARPGRAAFHRGRRPGDDRHQRGGLGGVRAVFGRPGQRRHEIRRQFLQRIVPHHAHQRQLARADAASERHQGG